jgi:aminoacrylate peracid reductase
MPQANNSFSGEKDVPKEIIQPPGRGPTTAPYSAGTRAGHVVYISGQVAFDAQGQVVGAGNLQRQTEQVLDNLKEVVEAAGGTLDDVVKTTVFITDRANFAAMNEVYARYFPANRPARSTVIAGLAREDLLVEIEAIAHVG